MGLFTRSIRPPDDIVPNDNTPAEAAPGTVGPDQQVRPGDPHGVEIVGDSSDWVPPRILPSAWSGWPADWWPPLWNGGIPAAELWIAWLSGLLRPEDNLQTPYAGS